MAEATETKETKETAAAKKSSDEAPVPEATPAIGAKHARYVDPPGNWSDPPELAEGESKVEGGFAKPPEEEAKKEREKVEKEEKEAFAKAHEENAETQKKRTQYDEKKAAERKAGTA